MRDVSTNKELFRKSETKWGDATNKNINKEEKYLISKYIKKGRVLEAGCGGGRLSFYINDNFDVQVDAFDFVSEFIENAKKEQSHINFFVADASNLSQLSSEQYEYEIYLQRLFSFVPPSRIDAAIEESYRLLKERGIMICSVLNYDGRKVNRVISPLIMLLRRIRKQSELGKTDLPWLKVRDNPNYWFLKKNQPTVHWFTRDEIIKKLTSCGYKVCEEFIDKQKPSILYLVCKKETSGTDSKRIS